MVFWGLVLITVGCLLSFGFCVAHSDVYASFGWILGDMLSGFVALCCMLMLLIVPISRHVDRNNCHKFAANTNRTTKFVKYNWFQWVCLTPQANGHWIPTNQLISVGKDGK